MANLNIRKLPDKTYRKIKGRAKQNGRSINSEIIYILNDVPQEEEMKVNNTGKDILKEILQIRNKLKGRKFPDSVKLIRQMRDEE